MRISKETGVSEPLLTDTERARCQGERLKRLRERLSVGKGHLMDALRLKTTNGYDMYERGPSNRSAAYLVMLADGDEGPIRQHPTR